MKVKIDIDIEVYCAQCGTQPKESTSYKQINDKHIVGVNPCPICLAIAKESGLNEALQRRKEKQWRGRNNDPKI